MTERISTRARMFSVTLCLIPLVLMGCGAGKRTRPRAEVNEAPLRLLVGSCETEGEMVACPVLPFRLGMIGYANTLEELADCQYSVDEMVQLCAVDKAELQGKVNTLQNELTKWYRNPWVMGLIGAAAGAAVVTGVTLSR